jgi:hypothetical protein
MCLTLHQVCSEYPKYMPHEWLEMLKSPGALRNLAFDADVLAIARAYERREYDRMLDESKSGGEGKVSHETPDEAKKRRKDSWAAFVKSFPKDHPRYGEAMATIGDSDD